MRTYFDHKYGQNFSNEKNNDAKSKSIFAPIRKQESPCVIEKINPWEDGIDNLLCDILQFNVK